MKPRVSVIIPAYNAEKTIVHALDSVRDQIYKNYEIIVINDGATDGTELLVKEFITKCPEVEVHYFYKENGGVSSARNFGLRKAKGNYIAFLDSDDIWSKDRLSRQLEIFGTNAEVDFLGTNRDGQHFNSFLNIRFGELNRITSRLLLYKNFFMTSSILFKSEIVDKVGYFNENMNHGEDLEYFLRISRHYNCYLLNKSMIRSYTGKAIFGDSGLSAELWKMEQGEINNITLGYKLGVVSFFEYLFLCMFSGVKFIRRIVITKFRNLKFRF